MSSHALLSRLLPHHAGNKHSAAQKVLDSSAKCGSASALAVARQTVAVDEAKERRRQQQQQQQALPTSQVPTFEECTDDSSDKTPSPSPISTPDRSEEGEYEYGPSHKKSLGRRQQQQGAAGQEGTTTTDDLASAAMTFDLSSSGVPSSVDKPTDDDDNDSVHSRTSGGSGDPSTTLDEEDDDDEEGGGFDAFLRLQTKRFESMRSLGALAPAAPAPDPPLPAPAAAVAKAGAATITAATPSVETRKGYAAADPAGTPETAPLSPLTPGSAEGPVSVDRSFGDADFSSGFGNEEDDAGSEISDAADDAPSSGPRPPPSWRDEARDGEDRPREYHRTRGNMSLRTPRFARRRTDDRDDASAAAAPPASATPAGSSSSNRALLSSGPSAKGGRLKKSWSAKGRRSLSSLMSRGGRKKNNGSGSKAGESAQEESGGLGGSSTYEKLGDDGREEEEEENENEEKGAVDTVTTGGGGRESTALVTTTTSSYAPHQTRPDLSRIRDPEGVGTAETKLSPFSLWYDDVPVANLDSKDGGEDGDGSETSDLLDASGLGPDGEKGDGAFNVGIARAAYHHGDPSASQLPRSGGPSKRSARSLANRMFGSPTHANGRKKSLSSDGLSFFFNRRGPACSSAAAIVYDTESDEEEDATAASARSEVRSTVTSATTQSIRMGIARPTRCMWDDDEDAYCGGALGVTRTSFHDPTTDEILADVELGPLHGYMLGRAPDALTGEAKDFQPVERTVHRQTAEHTDGSSARRLVSPGLHSTKYCTKSLMKKGVDVEGVEGLRAFPLRGTRPDTNAEMPHTPSPNVAAPASREELSRSMAGTGASSLQVLRDIVSKDATEAEGEGTDSPAKRGRSSAAGAPPSVLMSSLAYSAICNSDGESSDGDEGGGGGEIPSPDSGALVEYGSKSAYCSSARNLLASSSCRDLVVPASPGARSLSVGQAAPSSRALTIPSSNALTVVSEDVGAVAPTSKIYVLLIQPQRRLFELIQIVYYPSAATVGDLLDLIPANATEPILGRQAHVGLCRPKDKGPASVLTGLDVRASGMAEGGTANIYRGEILVAIPEGFTGEECKHMAIPILANKQFNKLMSKSDPLAPRTRRSRRGKGLENRGSSRSNRASYHPSSSASSNSSLDSISETDEL